MTEDLADEYLAGLPDDQRAALNWTNASGLTALRGYLALVEAVAFLGAGVSAPLYPLWAGLIGQLVDAASGRLTDQEAATCRALARESPEEVVEVIRRSLGAAVYREVLREVLRVRTDRESGRSWTPVQELVCRCAFKAVVTTNYDPGIVDARMRVRPAASATGFTTWEDEVGLDGWRTGDVFGEAELPVLFAHGQHNRSDSVVLATTEYRRAYAGKLPHVLGTLVDAGHLVWIGFSFADQRIAAILREIAERSGTRIDPGAPPRHVAIMPWDPAAEGNDPGILARRAEISYGAKVVLYPAPGGDHSALAALLASLADPRFPPVADLPARVRPAPAKAGPGAPPIPMTWVPAAERVEHFTGRTEELARLDRWAADREVALAGVTAWGGAGKTALVTHWVQEGGTSRRPGVIGVFGWSFYADSSAEHWVDGLLDWARRELGTLMLGRGRPAAVVLALRSRWPVLAGWCPRSRPRSRPGPGSMPAAPRRTLARIISPGGATRRTPRCGWPPATTWPGMSSAPCAPTPTLTGSKAPTAAGRPRRTPSMRGWSRRDWIPIRWPRSSGWWPPRKPQSNRMPTTIKIVGERSISLNACLEAMRTRGC